MRHADSIDRANPLTRDHERSITDMGRKAAAQVRQQFGNCLLASPCKVVSEQDL